jgi:hypothetical protein
MTSRCICQARESPVSLVSFFLAAVWAPPVARAVQLSNYLSWYNNERESCTTLLRGGSREVRITIFSRSTTLSAAVGELSDLVPDDDICSRARHCWKILSPWDPPLPILFTVSQQEYSYGVGSTYSVHEYSALNDHGGPTSE